MIRERLRQRLTRGKVECNLRFDLSSNAQSGLNMNEDRKTAGCCRKLG